VLGLGWSYQSLLLLNFWIIFLGQICQEILKSWSIKFNLKTQESGKLNPPQSHQQEKVQRNISCGYIWIETFWPKMKFIVKYIEEFCHMAGFYMSTTDRVRDQASLISHFDSNQMEWKIEINLDRQGRFNSRNGN
jgi:hypothetical protein